MAIGDAPKPNNTGPEQKEKITFKVLYAEDDDYLKEVTQMWLERWGYKVVAVENGKNLFNELATGKFDIVITDNNMPPGITGLQVLDTLRTEGNDVPVIVLTSDTIIKEKVNNLGGIFVSKNTQMKDLHTVIKEVLEETDKIG
jgi:CheY-like chemotaxis protein